MKVSAWSLNRHKSIEQNLGSVMNMVLLKRRCCLQTKNSRQENLTQKERLTESHETEDCLKLDTEPVQLDWRRYVKLKHEIFLQKFQK